MWKNDKASHCQFVFCNMKIICPSGSQRRHSTLLFFRLISQTSPVITSCPIVRCRRSWQRRLRSWDQSSTNSDWGQAPSLNPPCHGRCIKAWLTVYGFLHWSLKISPELWTLEIGFTLSSATCDSVALPVKLYVWVDDNSCFCVGTHGSYSLV